MRGATRQPNGIESPRLSPIDFELILDPSLLQAGFASENRIVLRIILWKLGIEWAHLKRALSPRYGHKVYYFAFGANLCASVLDERRIAVFDAFDYRLDGAALRFSQPGFYRQHGYASADPAAGEVVYGRIYLILERDAERMDYFEGVPFLGAHDKVVCAGDGFEFFYYRTTRIVDGLRPTREYLDYIVDAYREMQQVPPRYLERIEATAVLEHFEPLDSADLFVRDLARWPRWLHPALIAYERWCTRLVEFLWHRSPLQWMIRRPATASGRLAGQAEND